MIILVLGISGSGKDTQADLLAKDYGFAVVSTGQLVRDEIETGSELGKKMEEIVNNGEWVEDKTVYKLLEKRLEKLHGRDVILTGAVREASQIVLLDEALTNLGDDLDKVILFELSESEAVKRLSGRGREDDQPEAIKHRFAEFNESIAPIIAEYQKRGILLKIDAAPSIIEIHQEVVNQLDID
jgi:adenylate kinase